MWGYIEWKFLKFYTVCLGRINDFEMNSDRLIFNGNFIIFFYYEYYFLVDYENYVDI